MTVAASQPSETHDDQSVSLPTTSSSTDTIVEDLRFDRRLRYRPRHTVRSVSAVVGRSSWNAGDCSPVLEADS